MFIEWPILPVLRDNRDATFAHLVERTLAEYPKWTDTTKKTSPTLLNNQKVHCLPLGVVTHDFLLDRVFSFLKFKITIAH